ncbi:MAG TPA: alpha/beta hydrolase [Deinococcales bacterium]|nr:alpha/beta hydrolase [Deinococcales bacterium]
MSGPGETGPTPGGARGPDSGSERGTVVFLHAFPLNAGMWAEQAQAVQAAGWRAVTPDFPGFGSEPLDGADTLDAFAERIAATLRGLPVAPVVVGLSMGGYVAFRLLEQRVALRGLVLADTKATPDTPEAAARRRAAADRAQQEGLGWVSGEVVPGLLSPQPGPGALNRAQSLAAGASPEGFANAQRAMAARPDSRPVLRGLSVPTLILVGEHDQVTNLDEARAMAAAVPAATLAVIPGAGHLSNLENPAGFNARLLTFLRGLDA